MALKTVENFVARAIRLYEQEPEVISSASRFGDYVRRWVRSAGRGCNIGTKARMRQTAPAYGGRGGSEPSYTVRRRWGLRVFTPHSQRPTVPEAAPRPK